MWNVVPALGEYREREVKMAPEEYIHFVKVHEFCGGENGVQLTLYCIGFNLCLDSCIEASVGQGSS